MLGGSGYYRGSSVLISGTAGTGKSSLGACFVSAACGRGEQAIYFSFEEAPKQIIRNMGSIGIDLQTPVDQGLLTFHSVRVTSFGLEMHLAGMLRMIDEIKPAVVVIDPISNLSSVAVLEDVKEMLARIIDYMKMLGITAVFTDLSHTGSSLEATEAGISSLMDTWILLRDIELNGERNRGMYVLKSRGMSHSNQIREFIISREGISLKDVYIGPGGVLTGTARVVQEAAEAEEQILRQRKADYMRQELKRREKALQMRIQELKDAFTAEKEEIEQELAETQAKEKNLAYNTSALASMRGQDKEES